MAGQSRYAAESGLDRNRIEGVCWAMAPSRILLFLGLSIAFPSGLSAIEPPAVSSGAASAPVRVGYFHGLRIHLLYRAYVGGSFERDGVKVDLYTQYLHRPGLYPVPKDFAEMEEKQHDEGGGKSYFGMARGSDILDAIKAGALDGGVVGESSFVSAANKGDDIVAVAELGHYTKGYPGRGLVLRNDVHIDKPADFKGMTFATRRSGPGDGMLLREYFSSIGLDPEKDVTIIDQIDDDQQGPLLQKGKVQGLLAHFGKLEEPERLGGAYVYRKMDWVNPEVNLALLVFRRDFVAQRREEVVRIVEAYIERIRYESAIPEEEKRKESRNGLRMVSPAKGLKLPEWDDPPFVRLDLLEEVQRLLLKYHYLDKKTDLGRDVDRSVIEEAVHRLR